MRVRTSAHKSRTTSTKPSRTRARVRPRPRSPAPTCYRRGRRARFSKALQRRGPLSLPLPRQARAALRCMVAASGSRVMRPKPPPPAASTAGSAERGPTSERSREFLLQAAGRPPSRGRTRGRLYVSVLSSLICQFSVQLLTWRRKRSGWRWLTQVPKPFACDKTVIGTKSRARGEVHSSLLLFVSAKARNRLKQNPTSELLTATNFVAAASLFILIR